MKEIFTDLYTFEIPDKWEMMSAEDGIVSLSDPDGKGAITISSYSSEGGVPDVVNELKKFVSQDVLVRKKKFTNQDVAQAEYEKRRKGDIFFVYSVVVARQGNLLLASYYCKKSDLLPQELNTVKQIFESIVLKAT